MKKILILVAVVFLITPAFVFGQSTVTNGCSSGSVTQCVNQVYIWSMGAAALLALFMIVVGGYITLTSAGNAERATRGRSYIFSSLLGLALLFGAYILLKTINPDLVDFSKSCVNNLNTCGGTTNSQTPANNSSNNNNSTTPNTGTGLEGNPLDPGNTGCVFQCTPHN